MTVVCFPACLPVLLELERNPKNFRGISCLYHFPAMFSKKGGKRLGSEWVQPSVKTTLISLRVRMWKAEMAPNGGCVLTISL